MKDHAIRLVMRVTWVLFIAWEANEFLGLW